MKRKTLHTWLSCVALLLACLMVLTVLAGCKNPSENPTGTGTGNGTSTEAPATTTGKTEGPEFPEACDNHKGNFICENCGKRMTPNGFFTTMKATEADEAINVLVDNLSVTAKGDLIQDRKGGTDPEAGEQRSGRNRIRKGHCHREGRNGSHPV